MSRCVFTREAVADLRQIYEYIARNSPRNANSFLDRLEDQCEMLADHPYLGMARPEFGSNHRSFVVPRTRYIIIYRPAPDGVEIIHVRHGSQDLLRLFQ